MAALRIVLGASFAIVVVYTAIVIANHGMGLLPIFFGDTAKMEWPGQFNLGFTGFLVLSALWLAWRNDFSPFGLALGLLGFFGGVPVLTAYLLVTSFAVNGDVKLLLLGPSRVQPYGASSGTAWREAAAAKRGRTAGPRLHRQLESATTASIARILSATRVGLVSR